MTILVFIAVLLILILSHEAGHFFTARFFGIRVDEFGFGIPPRITGIKKGETLYSINWLPFGGFVKIFGEEGQHVDEARSFGSKSAWVRASVLIAGVAANALLAFLLFSIVSTFGVWRALSDEEAVRYPDARISIISVVPGSPAARADILLGDEVQSINGITFSSVQNIQQAILSSAGEEIKILLSRNGETFEKTITPRINPPPGEGALGVALSWTRLERAPWYRAPLDGARLTGQMFRGTVVGFAGVIKNLVHGVPQSMQVAGPVGIFQLTGETQRAGASIFLMFIGVLSVNLAIINILPIPGLDGGRLLFVVLESVRGRKISSRFSSIFHGVGLALLIALIIAVTIHDVSRFF